VKTVMYAATVVRVRILRFENLINAHAMARM
jgi:hypothetical protein